MAGNSRRHPSIGRSERADRLEPARDVDDGHPWSMVKTATGKQAGAVMSSSAEPNAVGLDHAK